jgi:hypothetical protein
MSPPRLPTDLSTFGELVSHVDSEKNQPGGASGSFVRFLGRWDRAIVAVENAV